MSKPDNSDRQVVVVLAIFALIGLLWDWRAAGIALLVFIVINNSIKMIKGR